MSSIVVRPSGEAAVAPQLTEESVLALVDRGRAELIAAVAAGDPAAVADVVKRAEAIRYLSKKAGLALEAANAAGRLKVDAERRAGAMLREAKEAGEYGQGKPDVVSGLGTNHQTVHRWQDMARVPEHLVQGYLKTQEEKRAEITSAAIQHMGARLRRMEKITEKQETYEETPLDERPVPVIYADPPWQYHFAVSDSRKIENQYPTLTVDEIAKKDPAPAEDAVLFLWVTSPKLPEGLQIMEAWGFTYKTSMVWVKPRPSSVIDGRRTVHSAKVT